MKDLIQEKLKKIEEDRNVTVLYACEVGSRVYGFDHENSDYDVRFIYAHPLDWYLRISEGNDNIQIKNGDFDISGWDLRKSLRLAQKSNTGLLEMLNSPIIYRCYDDFVFPLKDEIMEKWSYKAVAHHYINFASSSNGTRVKDILYTIRGILCVDYLFDHDCIGFPPLNFDSLVYSIMHPNSILKADIDHLLKLKKEGRGKEEYNDPSLVTYINRKINLGRDRANHLPSSNIDIDKLNELFRTIVKRLS